MCYHNNENSSFSDTQSTFPKTHRVPMYMILKMKNKQKKSPLQLAIEKGNIGLVQYRLEHFGVILHLNKHFLCLT